DHPNGRRSSLQAPPGHDLAGHGRSRRRCGDHHHGGRHHLRHGNGTQCRRARRRRRLGLSRAAAALKGGGGAGRQFKRGAARRHRRAPGGADVTRPNGEQGSDKAQGQRGAPARRFYQTATIAHIAASAPLGEAQPEGYRVLLDGKVLRTPAKGHLVVPTRALAAAIAAEWQAQREQIDPASMPLTRLTNSAIDGVAGRQAEVGADIVKYLGSDLVCYRAADPSELVRRQAEAWDPPIDWCQAAFDIKLTVTSGILPVAQPATA